MRSLALLLFIAFYSFVNAQPPAGYYDLADGKSGLALKKALYDIVKGHVPYYYTSSTSTDVWDVLKVSDRDPQNADNVILLYSGLSVNAAQEYNNGNGWTREHVWAKSRGDFGTDVGAGTDCHHLRPENDNINSTRSNLYFDEGGSPVYYLGVLTGCYKNSIRSTFEPRDAVKGDVARMIMYMAVRYEGENGEPDLEMTETINGDADKQPLMGVKSTLLKWNMQDLPDDFEKNRNEVVYTYQFNRNPFIDHPEYATAIWGEETGVGGIVEPVATLFYSKSSLVVHFTEPIKRVKVIDLMGRVVYDGVYSGEMSVEIDGLKLGKGLFLLVINDGMVVKIAGE